MSNLLVIFGITGQQGASVANHVLNDAELSSKYTLRGITRDASKPEAQALAKKGIEIVTADMDDRTSIQSALKGAHTVFAMTASMYIPGGFGKETEQGKTIADETVAAGAKFLIYSTVPSPSKLTNGKFSVGSFDCKDAVNDYIETLPIRSAFFSPGGFMQNFQGHMSPRPGPDGQLAVTNFLKPETPYPLIDIAGDTGKFVGAILAEPEKYAGKTFCAATKSYSLAEMVDIMSKACGKPIEYNQIPKEVFAKFLPEATRDSLLNMFSYIEYCGYYGQESKELVEWAVKNARGAPSTFEEYLQREPLNV